MQGWRGGTVGEGLCGGNRLAEGTGLRRGGRRPGGEAADTGAARVFRRSRNGLRPDACPLQGAGFIKPLHR